MSINITSGHPTKLLCLGPTIYTRIKSELVLLGRAWQLRKNNYFNIYSPYVGNSEEYQLG